MSGLYDNSCCPLLHLVPSRSLRLDVLHAHSPSPYYPYPSLAHGHSYRTPPQDPDTSS